MTRQAGLVTALGALAIILGACATTRAPATQQPSEPEPQTQADPLPPLEYYLRVKEDSRRTDSKLAAAGVANKSRSRDTRWLKWNAMAVPPGPDDPPPRR
jgi:hypothetical protein